ncbi:glycosyl hydrolase family 18 protein [Erwinia sp. HDF1-3R]|uniref:carbohydrate-binding protein n=1 Tax=Erwinia sp. HDF1-3R TaxID=3141543 RepID=UPI0031F49835
MKKISLALMISASLFAQSAMSAEQHRTLSYLTSWGLPSDAAAQLEHAKVDTWLLSFGGWDAQGNISSSDKLLDIPEYNAWYLETPYTTWTQVKLAHPEKKMMVAFGGETYESMWSHLDNSSNREKIAQGLVKLLNTDFPVYKKNLKPEEMLGECLSHSWDGKTCEMGNYQKAGTVHLDGIDFDFEKAARLTPEENDNLLHLAQRVRQLLGPDSKKLISLTTYHVGADPENCANSGVTQDCSFVEEKRSSHHGEVLPLLTKGKNIFDFFNVMTYDAGPNFKYKTAMANYARAVGDPSKILLGNTINSQWGPDGRYVELREKNIERAAWQARNNYGGFFVWTLGSNNQQLSFSDQVDYINEMKEAANEGNESTVNRPPTAIVNYPAEVTGAAHVILDGSASVDPEEAPLSFKWEQISGPTVTLINKDRDVASFELSSTPVDVNLGFRLTVNDGELDSAPADIIIKHKAEVTEEKPVDDKPIDDKPTDDKPVDDKPVNEVQGAWQSGKVYVGGDVVSWQGKEYKARWWTRGDQPGNKDVWENLNKAGSEQWNTERSYFGGAKVVWEGKTWVAKWWTKGEQPGHSDVWQSQ